MRNLFVFFTLFLSVFVFANSNQKQKLSVYDIEIDADFIYLPISPKADYREVEIKTAEGKTIFNEPVMLGIDKGQWYAPIDVSEYKGQTLSVVFSSEGMMGTPNILTSDSIFSRDYSQDRARPKFHVSATDGIMGSSSGLFYFKGEYYAYVLQNAKLFSLAGSFNLALWKSSDLVNWKAVVAPSLVKSKIHTPSSVYVDNANKSKLFENSGIILAYSDFNSQTCLAFSSNATDFKYLNDAQPVLEGNGKWPQIFYNEQSKLWTLIRTELFAENKSCVAIYVSEDLQKWERTDTVFRDIDNTNANLFQISVEGGITEQKKWVILSGLGQYIVGDFDGRKFKRYTKKPINIFAGNISFVQVWNSMPDGDIIASATITQPTLLISHIEQGFMNSLSLPWKLTLVRVRGGEFQLRANVANQINEHISFADDASGGTMEFSSNVFTIPNAYGNYCLYEGIASTQKTTDFVKFEVGVAGFMFGIRDKKYQLMRITKEAGFWDAPVERDSKIVSFKAFVDSYSVEVSWFTGDIVMMSGDSFINPQQTIKIGAGGPLKLEQLLRKPIFKNKIKELREANYEIFKLKHGKKSESANNVAPSSDSTPNANIPALQDSKK